MRNYRFVRAMLAVLLGGGTMMAASCQNIAKDSVKTGIFSWISGSVNELNTSNFGNVLIDMFIGSGTGGDNSIS